MYDARMPTQPARAPTRPREERERRILDVAARLFYARGVHAVGMDELVAASGFGKATVYRLFPSKDALVDAYLRRSSAQVLELVDADVERHAGDPAGAIRAIFTAVAADVARRDFRGCAFNNAGVEFGDRNHPARVMAREHRAALHARLRNLALAVSPTSGEQLGARLALIVDGMYTSAAHLGPDGPAAAGPGLAEALLAQAGG
jgi:AcrR family transcriptional regulator